ncbi:MAG: hypothetical protein IJJ19_05600 [Erysipelotrichaceae bacterium]|nr:hypothetical protein [Erysipelotrichaceae bacterium]
MSDERIEVMEAIKEADKSLEHLYRAQDLLAKASGWGIADIIGGGLFITMIKRNRISEAQSELVSARTHINNLLREMNDVRKVDYIRINTDGFAGFADFMGDPISDIYIQTKIESARKEVDETILKIEQIRVKLNKLI